MLYRPSPAGDDVGSYKQVALLGHLQTEIRRETAACVHLAQCHQTYDDASHDRRCFYSPSHCLNAASVYNKRHESQQKGVLCLCQASGCRGIFHGEEVDTVLTFSESYILRQICEVLSVLYRTVSVCCTVVIVVCCTACQSRDPRLFIFSFIAHIIASVNSLEQPTTLHSNTSQLFWLKLRYLSTGGRVMYFTTQFQSCTSFFSVPKSCGPGGTPRLSVIL